MQRVSSRVGCGERLWWRQLRSCTQVRAEVEASQEFPELTKETANQDPVACQETSQKLEKARGLVLDAEREGEKGTGRAKRAKGATDAERRKKRGEGARRFAES